MIRVILCQIEAIEVARDITRTLRNAGLEVYLDDSNERGRFERADAAGWDVRIAIGVKCLPNARVEVRSHGQDGFDFVPISDVLTDVQRRLARP